MSLAQKPLTMSWSDLARNPGHGFGSESSARPTPAALTLAPVSTDELVGLELEPGTRDVAQRMLAHGASAEFVRLIVSAVQREGASGAYAIDAAAALLARSVPILPSPKRPRRGERVPLFAFVGPTGVGKTSTLVKLGRRLREAGRRVAFASLDPLSLDSLERVGGLASDVDRGEIPLEVVRDAADVRKLIRHPSALDVLLLDTPGISPREEERLDELARELERCSAPCERTTLLVLAASAGRGALRLTTKAFAPFRAEGAILTKLDETDEPAVAVEALVRAGLALLFLCDGQDTRGHLWRPTPESMSDLVLRGHLAGGSAA